MPTILSAIIADLSQLIDRPSSYTYSSTAPRRAYVSVDDLKEIVDRLNLLDPRTPERYLAVILADKEVLGDERVLVHVPLGKSDGDIIRGGEARDRLIDLIRRVRLAERKVASQAEQIREIASRPFVSEDEYNELMGAFERLAESFGIDHSGLQPEAVVDSVKAAVHTVQVVAKARGSLKAKLAAETERADLNAAAAKVLEAERDELKRLVDGGTKLQRKLNDDLSAESKRAYRLGYELYWSRQREKAEAAAKECAKKIIEKQDERIAALEAHLDEALTPKPKPTLLQRLRRLFHLGPYYDHD